MAGTLVIILGDNAEEVEIGSLEGEAGFLVDLADGGPVGGFSGGHFEFAADGAPEAEVGGFITFHEEQVALGIAQVDKGADFVGKRIHDAGKVGRSENEASPLPEIRHGGGTGDLVNWRDYGDSHSRKRRDL